MGGMNHKVINLKNNNKIPVSRRMFVHGINELPPATNSNYNNLQSYTPTNKILH